MTSLRMIRLPMTLRVPAPPLVSPPPVDVASLSETVQLMTFSVPLLLFAIAPPEATIVPPRLSTRMLSTTFTMPVPSCATAPPQRFLMVGRWRA